MRLFMKFHFQRNLISNELLLFHWICLIIVHFIIPSNSTSIPFQKPQQIGITIPSSHGKSEGQILLAGFHSMRVLSMELTTVWTLNSGTIWTQTLWLVLSSFRSCFFAKTNTFCVFWFQISNWTIYLKFIPKPKWLLMTLRLTSSSSPDTNTRSQYLTEETDFGIKSIDWLIDCRCPR